jgi:ABC-type dipeptide/oligopeptide/nickel transport system permease subunit
MTFASTRNLKNHHPFLLSSLFLLFIIGALIYAYISPYNGLDLREDRQLQPPSFFHPFGTDPDGRDLFLRVIIGVKAYFLPGVVAVGIAITFGVILGIVGSGVWKRIPWRILAFFAQSFMDLLESFPKYILILLAITILPNPTFYHVMLILGLLNSPKVGKLVMERIRFLERREFIEAAEALGLKKLKIIQQILFYNCTSILLVQASLQMAEVIMIEIGLSYLGSVSDWGLGVTIQEPMPSWGNILVIAKNHFTDGWWLTLFPLMIAMLNIITLSIFTNNIIKMFTPQRSSFEREWNLY